MRAVRLHPPGGIDALSVDEIEVPQPGPGEVLVRVHAAAITRDELDWPVDRLPAIPSYELSGTVVETDEEVWALTPFSRDGVAAEYAAVPADVLAPRPTDARPRRERRGAYGRPDRLAGPVRPRRAGAGQRVLILGAAGGVGHVATSWPGGAGRVCDRHAPRRGCERARGLGADEVVERATRGSGTVEPVDLVFDTVGGEGVARSPTARARRPAGRRRRGAPTEIAEGRRPTSSSSPTATSSSSSPARGRRRRSARRSTRCSRWPTRVPRSSGSGLRQTWEGRARCRQ